MPILRKVLVVALFVLFSAMLFAALMKPVLFGLAACYGYWSFSPPGDLLLTLVEIITLAMSAAIATGVFLLAGLIIRRR